MKNFIIILLTVCLLAGCEKQSTSVSETPTALARSNYFPTYIKIISDTSVFRKTSVSVPFEAYLNSCGYAPPYEAPSMGVEFYQIQGGTQSAISIVNTTVTFSNLAIGSYKFVGHAYVVGYRTCDSSYINDNAYDTITVNITKNKKK